MLFLKLGTTVVLDFLLELCSVGRVLEHGSNTWDQFHNNNNNNNNKDL